MVEEKQQPRPVVFVNKKTQCPDCGSNKTRTLMTVLPIRYHVCHSCGKRFKSANIRD